MNVPSWSELNTMPLAVASTPAQPGPSYFTSHLRCPVSGSMARSAPVRVPTGATVPPIVRSPTLASGVSFLMNFAHVSRTVRKNRPRCLSNDGGMKFVLPYQSGQLSVPSAVGTWPGISIGRPAGVKPDAQFWLPYCQALMNLPLVRSST